MTSAVAQGKINLLFQVGELQKSGYHDVVSLYQALELFETVTVSQSDAWGVSVVSDLPIEHIMRIPKDESNICIQAAFALAKFVNITNPQPMHFEIEKQIPVAGGMAGGSADAAAALIALNQAWCLGLEISELMQVAAALGADVPFCLMGGTAIGSGSGIKLEKLADISRLFVVLILNQTGLKTQAVFSKFDELELGLEVLEQYAARSLAADLAQGVQNDAFGENTLKAAATELLPELQESLKLDLGIGTAYLSGSGPTIWFATDNLASAETAVQKAKELGFLAILSSTSNLGARLI
jgi:4-diphosphocytidyl-2-C-methyl-D-erythritol kinase